MHPFAAQFRFTAQPLLRKHRLRGNLRGSHGGARAMGNGRKFRAGKFCIGRGSGAYLGYGASALLSPAFHAIAAQAAEFVPSLVGVSAGRTLLSSALENPPLGLPAFKANTAHAAETVLCLIFRAAETTYHGALNSSWTHFSVSSSLSEM
jgi:hypothetical protein